MGLHRNIPNNCITCAWDATVGASERQMEIRFSISIILAGPALVYWTSDSRLR